MSRGWGDGIAPDTNICYHQWNVCEVVDACCSKPHPIPKEEAREDAGAEEIIFHVYEYKVLLWLDRKERRQLEFVQKYNSIGEFHCIHYWPALSCERYDYGSYMLAACCRKEWHAITHGCVNSHCDYSKRLSLSFNKEIQFGYYQSTSISVESASLEWVDDDEKKHDTHDTSDTDQ